MAALKNWCAKHQITAMKIVAIVLLVIVAIVTIVYFWDEICFLLAFLLLGFCFGGAGTRRYR